MSSSSKTKACEELPQMKGLKEMRQLKASAVLAESWTRKTTRYKEHYWKRIAEYGL